MRTIDDLLPKDQAEKIPLLLEIRGLLLDARRHAHGKVLQEIDDNMPPESLRPLTDADLPDEVARRFTERDGTRGRILYVENQKDSDIWDGRYLVRWAESLRRARLADGTRPPLAGRAPVFADMVESVWSNGPRATLLALAAVCVLVLLAFRSFWPRLLTVCSLLLGVLWMAGAMALMHLRLNFLNFVALVSANRALRSFGLAAAIGEVTCLSAGVLVLPALMLVLIRRREGRAAKLANAAATRAGGDAVLASDPALSRAGSRLRSIDACVLDDPDVFGFSIRPSRM